MASILTESEVRGEVLRDTNVAINVAFLHDIKQDHVEFRQLLGQMAKSLRPGQTVDIRDLSDQLGRLRDELETYFALEEFYGGFDQAVQFAWYSNEVGRLRQQHTELYLQLDNLVEDAERILYHETSSICVEDVLTNFQYFRRDLAKHEQHEMDIIMRECNEDIGGGD